MISGKLGSKGRTTIPRPVRDGLKLEAGDDLFYEIRGDQVIITKSRNLVGFDPFALFNEWDSEADRKAYANL